MREKKYSDAALVAAVKEHGGQRPAARALGVSQKTVWKAVRQKGKSIGPIRPISTKPAGRITVASVVAKLDDGRRVREYLNAMPSGEIELGEQVQHALHISEIKWRVLMRETWADEYRCVVPRAIGFPGGTYFGSKRTIRDLKDKI